MQKFTVKTFMFIMFWSLVFGWIISSALMYYIITDNRTCFLATMAASVVMLVKLIHGSDFFRKHEVADKKSILAGQDIIVRQ